MSDKVYPRGQIALGNGDLTQVTDVKLDDSNEAKNVHTLRESPSGVVVGKKEHALSFNAVVDAGGFEQDYFKLLMDGTIKQVRIKVPGETITFTGVVSKRSLELPLDTEIKYSIDMVGRSETS